MYAVHYPAATKTSTPCRVSEFYNETVRNAFCYNRACSDEKLWLSLPWPSLQLGGTTDHSIYLSKR